MKVNVIAIESAAKLSEVALLQVEQGQKKLWQQISEGQGQHAEQILPMLDNILKQANINRSDINSIVFSQGPGSFTGLRIACGIAQGIALGLGLKVIPINSLRATAQKVLTQLANKSYVMVLLDARMQETFMAVYQYQQDALDPLEQIQAPCLIAIDDIPIWLSQQAWLNQSPLYIMGDALAHSPELKPLLQKMELTNITLGDDQWYDACTLAKLGYAYYQQNKQIEASHAAPIYIRDKVAFTTAERQAGLGGNPKVSLPRASKTEIEVSIPSDYVLTHLQKDDLEQIISIEQTVSLAPWSQKNFDDSLKAGYQGWVLKHKDTQQLVAYAVQMLAPDVAHLLIIGVDQAFQRQGLGEVLLTFTEQNLLKHNLNKQILEVRESNIQAQNFYLKNNYQIIGKRKDYYSSSFGDSENALVLEKVID